MLWFKIIGDSKAMLPLFNNNKPMHITLIKQSVQRLHPFTNFNKPSWGVGRLAVGLFILGGVMAMLSLSERERRKIKSCLYLSHLICPVFLQWERITPRDLRCKQMECSSLQHFHVKGLHSLLGWLLYPSGHGWRVSGSCFWATHTRIRSQIFSSHMHVASLPTAAQSRAPAPFLALVRRQEKYCGSPVLDAKLLLSLQPEKLRDAECYGNWATISLNTPQNPTAPCIKCVAINACNWCMGTNYTIGFSRREPLLFFFFCF